MTKSTLHQNKPRGSIIRKMIAVYIGILIVVTNIGISLANDYEGETNIGSTAWSKANGNQEWVVTEYDKNWNHVGATGTKVTVYVGEDYSISKSVYYNQGEGVSGTVYKGYDWSSCTGKDAPPSNGFNTDTDQMKKMIDAIGLDTATKEKIKQGEVVTILSEPTVRIKNTKTGEVTVGTVVEILVACKNVANNGVKNGQGIRYVENYSKSIFMKLKEEQPELYTQILAYANGQGQAVHQERLYQPPTPTPDEPTPTPDEPTPTPDEPTPTPDEPTPTPDEPTPTLDEPTPTLDTPELPPDSTKYTVTEADAPTRNNYTAQVKIDNEKFKVFLGYDSNGNPIPTNENLTLNGCTSLVGVVKNLGLNTVRFTDGIEYTVYAYWSREEERTGERQKEIDGVLQVDKNNKPIIEEYTYTVTISGVETATVYSQNWSTNYYKIRRNTNWAKLKNVLVSNDSFGEIKFNSPRGINYFPTIYSDVTRISEKTCVVSGSYEYASDAEVAAEEFAKSASWSDFWNVTSDVLGSSEGEIRYNGVVSNNACNKLTEKTTKTKEVENKSLGGDAYPSTGLHDVEWIRITGEETGWPFKPNAIRIHTPIYNEMEITSPSINQLENINGVTSGYKIVTIGDEFTVTVNVSGPYEYYYFPDGTTHRISLDTSKYVKDVIIDCGVCGKQYHSKTHTCEWYNTIEKNDDTEYQITTTVIAKNSGPKGEAEANKNEPDDIYVLKQYGGVHLVGKIYDLEVRTTDDPGWKLRMAEKLAKLPTGEKGDNAINSYKYGIKLGYRAYFDLKTLGTASKDIVITPKIYYVDKDGNQKEVDLYYRTSKTEYKKLEDNDIEISMVMNKTNGDVNNKDFKIERAAMLVVNPNINYNQKITIGGLKNIKLTAQNSVATKYNGVYTWKPTVEHSRRWYGEVYIPASTIVAEKGATVAEITRGAKVLEDGYLIISFEEIVSRRGDESRYLNYSIGRTTDGVKFSPDASNKLVSPSIMYEEKTNDEKQALKSEITLPNGKIFKGYEETEAPIIIYDVSLRANDDYEQTGTH